MKNNHRLSFSVPADLFKASRAIPWGLRSSLLRILLQKVVEAGEKHGKMLYGAVLEGDWEIVPKEKD